MCARCKTTYPRQERKRCDYRTHEQDTLMYVTSFHHTTPGKPTRATRHLPAHKFQEVRGDSESTYFENGTRTYPPECTDAGKIRSEREKGPPTGTCDRTKTSDRQRNNYEMNKAHHTINQQKSEQASTSERWADE